MPRDTLQPGLSYEFKFTIPENKTVPFLYPEAPEFQAMPRVLATGFMVGLFEWACIKAVNPHIEWPAEQTVGTSVAVNHVTATPPGLTVRVHVTLVRVEGRKLSFSIVAHDDIDANHEKMCGLTDKPVALRSRDRAPHIQWRTPAPRGHKAWTDSGPHERSGLQRGVK